MVGYLEEGQVSFVKPPYATGDLAKKGLDGQIFYRGRRDSQTKIRGHRIDLIEIERVLDSHTRIQECAVCVFEGKLIAFVRSEADISVLAVRQHVASVLPPYMVPTQVNFVNALPRHDNLKIDRKKLENMARD